MEVDSYDSPVYFQKQATKEGHTEVEAEVVVVDVEEVRILVEIAVEVFPKTLDNHLGVVVILVFRKKLHL